MRSLAILATILVLAGHANAAAILRADIVTDRPARVDGGFNLDSAAADVAIVHPTSVAIGTNQTVLAGLQAKTVLHRWVYPAGLPRTGHVLRMLQVPDVDANPVLYDLEVNLIGLVGDVAVLLDGSFAGRIRTDLGSHLEAADAVCEVGPAQGDQRFPAHSPEEDRSVQRSGPEGQVDATCRALAVSSQDVPRVVFYGVDLFVADQERRYVVRTGTFDEKDELGQTRRVVQMLEVRRHGGPLAFTVTDGAEVWLRTPAFLADGELSLGPANGHLEWGSRTDHGEVPPVAARGSFAFRSSPSRSLLMEGVTLEDPRVETSAATTHRTLPAGLVAGTALALGLLVVAGLLLYARPNAATALAHARRQAIYEFVRTNPGVPVNRVARALAIPGSIASHHLAVLERAGLLRTHRIGGVKAVFPRGAEYAGREVELALLRRPTMDRLRTLLQAEPGLAQRDIAERLGITQQNVSHHLRLLERMGLVVAEETARRRSYSWRRDATDRA